MRSSGAFEGEHAGPCVLSKSGENAVHTDEGFRGCEHFSGRCRLPVFPYARGQSHPLNQLLSNIQFGAIRSAAGQPGIDEFFAKQLVCGQAEKNVQFRRRESQSNECRFRFYCH
jgi:hypothetical protein